MASVGTLGSGRPTGTGLVPVSPTPRRRRVGSVVCVAVSGLGREATLGPTSGDAMVRTTGASPWPAKGTAGRATDAA